MLLSTLFISLTVLLSSAQAYTLPEGSIDGIYRVKEENGIETHIKISDFPSPTELKAIRKRYPDSAPTSPRRIYPRYFWDLNHCGCGHYMNPGNTDEAVAALKGQLTENVNREWPGYYSFYVIRGSTVAFSCSGGNGYVWMNTADDYGRLLWELTEVCGRYVAATKGLSWSVGSSGATKLYLNRGYMNHYPGLNFCQAATGSAAQNCR